MKKKLRKFIPLLFLAVISLAVILPSAVLFVPQAVYAQAPPATTPPATAPPATTPPATTPPATTPPAAPAKPQPKPESVDAGYIGNMVLQAIGAIVQWVINMLGLLTLALIHVLLLVAGYNGYMDSPAITTGWVVVRDVANLFFVAIILVVSIGSIVNPERFGGVKKVFRILLYALLVNFSRTIAGLFIDISQLVMLTFVNGFAQAAGGNFVEALGVSKIGNISPGDTAMKFSGLMSQYILALLMMIIITVIIAVMVVALVVRMVTLWMLVVLSPLAFALGSSDLTHAHYAEWWKKFSAELTTGPIVAFFLWLSLVTFQNSTGSGIVGGTGLHDKGSSAETSCGDMEACSQENLIRFIVATVMLLAGLGFAKEFSGVGGSLAGAALAKGKQYSLGATKWAAKKAALPVAAIATGGIAGGVVAGGIALASRSQRVRNLTGQGLSKVPGLRSAGLRIQANVAKERMENLKKSEETAKYATWQQMKKRTYTVDKTTGEVKEDMTVNRDTALANYKLLMKDKEWQANSTDEEKQFVMGKATQYAKEIKDKESLDLVADVEKINPNLIPPDKKASDPAYNTDLATGLPLPDPRFNEVMDNLSTTDALKMDSKAFTAKVVARLPDGAIERVFKDGNAAQQKALGDILKKFADTKDTSISKTDRDAHYEKIENNQRGVDTLSKSELSSADMVKAVMDKPVTKDREDLFRDKDKKATISKTANDELNAVRSSAGYTYDDRTSRLAEAAAVADESLDKAYRSGAGMIADTRDKDALGKALNGKSKIEVTFAAKTSEINAKTDVGQIMAEQLQANDVVDLAKKAEGNSVKGDKIRAIIETMTEMESKTIDATLKKKLGEKLEKIGKNQIASQYMP